MVASRGVGRFTDLTARSTDILVVGAGPTGLALALFLRHQGVGVRLVERRPEAWRPSRAFVLHARTLELLRPTGVTDTLLRKGDPCADVRIHLGALSMPATLDRLPIGATPFPYVLLERQTDVESTLCEALLEEGVAVERATELIAARQGASSVRATLRRRGCDETVECLYVAGCDGSTSTVRQLAGIGWKGGPTRRSAVLADIDLEGDLEPGTAHAFPGCSGLLLLLPLGEQATWRLVAMQRSGVAPPAGFASGVEVGTAGLQALLDRGGLEARISGVAWSKVVPLQQRIAEHYRRGRLFLAGDAAHVHSPAGGEGMNTGIQDAANLGWKLAFAAQSVERSGDEPECLLDSYEQERLQVARQVLALTRAVSWAETGAGWASCQFGAAAAPLLSHLLPPLARRRRILGAMLRVLSQLWVSYPHSPLSLEEGKCGRARPGPGERAPDEQLVTAEGAVRLHELLSTPAVHVLLQRDAPDLAQLAAPKVKLHRVTSWPGSGMVVLRPDGHVGLRSSHADHETLRRWLAILGTPWGSPPDPTLGVRRILERPADA